MYIYRYTAGKMSWRTVGSSVCTNVYTQHRNIYPEYHKYIYKMYIYIYIYTMYI